MNLEAQMTQKTLIQTAVRNLVAYEPTLEDKLDMLTSISITTQNDDVWEASEEVRNELCSNPDQERMVFRGEEDGGVPSGHKGPEIENGLHVQSGHAPDGIACTGFDYATGMTL
jgi:hypothetical protein